MQFTATGGVATQNDGNNDGGTLDDFLYRRYNPTQGRWISPDPAGLGAVNPANPQTRNRYAYVVNSPLTLTDPSGLFGEGGGGGPCDWEGDCGPGGGGDPCEWGGCGGPGGGWGGGWNGPSLGLPTLGGRGNPAVASSIFTGEDCLGCWSLGPSPLAIVQALLSGNLVGALQSTGAIPSDAIDCTSGICQVNPVMDAGPAANNGTPQTPLQEQQQCLNNFYNSKLGKAAQFGSPLALLPGWNPQWGSNLQEWGITIFGKLGGLFGSGAMSGTTQLTTLSGTTTVGSTLELGTGAVLGAIEKVATPAMIGATAIDVGAHLNCGPAYPENEVPDGATP